jgi:isocitrate dehydrogenase (NAD+)
VGAATTSVDGPGSPTLALRRALGLDLLVRPAKGADVDVVVVGHAFEGLFGSEEEAGPDGVRLARVVTRAGVTRLLTEARRHVRRRLTVVDKPTVFRQTAALFRSCGAEEIDNLDAVVARLVARPGHDDVLVGLSFVSDVLSDLTAALAGGVGAVASCSLGPDVAVFEPVHGSAPRRTERPLAVDPSGAILAGAMLARHLGHDDIADGIEAAVRVVAPQRGQLSTRGFGEAVRRAL